MAIASFDVEIQAILRFGFDYIIAHPDVIDDIFANFKEGHMWKMYGDKEIQKIKKWITENEIPVVLSWSLNPQRIPCVSVHIASSSEDTTNSFLGDHGGIVETPKDPRTIIPEFVPLEYDVVNSVITVPDSIDLSLVRPAHIVYDGNNEPYMITEVQGHSITIQLEGPAVTPNKFTVKSFIETTRVKRGETYVQEAVDIGIHGHSDQNTVLWLYYMILWISLRFKPEIEKRCMDLSTFSASDFKRDSQYLGENIFSRWMRVTARTRVSWTEDPYPEIDTLVANVEYDDGVE